MKLRNIVSVLTATLFLMGACSEEETFKQGGDSGLTISLTTKAIVTKAVSEGYKTATPEEIQINNAAIAVFQGSTRVGFEYAAFDNGLATGKLDDNRAYYEVKDIPVKKGDLTVLVLANSTLTEDQLMNADTPDRFRKLKEVVQDTGNDTFDATKLVKFGESSITVAGGGAAKTELIELTQLAARVDLSFVVKDPETEEIEGSPWSFNVTELKIANVALQSYAFMYTEEIAKNELDKADAIGKSFNLPLEDSEGNKLPQSFYTYEKNYANPENPLLITVKGDLMENGVKRSEGRTYKLSFNPDKKGECRTSGVVHGNVYDLLGTIDAKALSLNFSWSVLPWIVQVRNVNVSIIKPAFLVVTDTEMTMPNITSISTTFQSSSPITCSNPVVVNGNDYQDMSGTITVIPEKNNKNKGTITISTDKVPINFVPKTITFTVTNEDNISENVKITQYPPLYITASTSLNKPSGSDNQTNRNMYEFKSLIADYSRIGEDPYTFDLKESWWAIGTNFSGENGHKGSLSTREKNAASAAAFIRTAVLAYPKTTDKLFNESFVSSAVNGERGSYELKGTVACTQQDAENNNRISPYFVLASQNGINNNLGVKEHEWFCARYVEQDLNKVNYPEGDYGKWRVPTLAELRLIDILQNTTQCDVKRILEGENYWCATPVKLDLVDPRLNGADAVRCVRDVYRVK